MIWLAGIVVLLVCVLTIFTIVKRKKLKVDKLISLNGLMIALLSFSILFFSIDTILQALSRSNYVIDLIIIFVLLVWIVLKAIFIGNLVEYKIKNEKKE